VRQPDVLEQPSLALRLLQGAGCAQRYVPETHKGARMTHNFDNLKDHILPLSNSDDFQSANNEWKLIGVEIQEEWDSCPCRQRIKERCHIENQLNRNRTYVGNVCLNQFIGIDTGNLYAFGRSVGGNDDQGPRRGPDRS
jgi:hypothetical protein